MERASNVKVNIIEYFGDLEEIYGCEKVADFEYEIFELYQNSQVKFEKWAEENNIILDGDSLEMWVFKFAE